MHYLFETSACETVNSQHDRCGANEPSGDEHHMVVNLRDSADAEPDDANACGQDKWRSMSDRKIGFLIAN